MRISSISEQDRLSGAGIPKGTHLAAGSVGSIIPTHHVSQQTLLALCALAVAGLFMQSVTQASIQAEIGALRSEVNMTAAGILQETFDWASQLQFDERSPADDQNGLTEQEDWVTRDWYEAVALENLNGASHEIRRSAGVDSLHFDISAEVHYMIKNDDETWSESETDRTMTKRLTLTVTGPMNIQARAERLYSQSGF